MAECFCGCGRKVRFGRRWLSNQAAEHTMSQLETMRGAAEVAPSPAAAAELRDIVARGDRLRDPWREYIHGTRSRDDFDRDAAKRLLSDIAAQRKRMAEAALDADFVGWDMHTASVLWATGRHARARLTDIRDTGVTVNASPRAEITLLVEPEGEEPFELRRKLIVSRVRLPRVGETVEVAYDPDDRERFTFRVPDLSDDGPAANGPAGRIEQLAKLQELREAGALTDEEFAREKARLLTEPG